MSEYDLYKLAALDETVSHFFFPALALHQRRRFAGDADDEDDEPYSTDEDLEPIRIPDTILYSYSKPIMWLYFDEATKQIMKRPAKYLNAMSILEHFTDASKSKIGVRAWFVYPQEPDLILPQTSDFLVDVVSQESVGRTGVLRFLQSPKGKGILQHYIDNKTESDGSMKNVYIHCDYSPSHFSTELYVSAKTLTVPAPSDGKKGGGGGTAKASPHGGGGRGAAGVSLALRFSPYASAYERRPLVSSVMTTRLRNVCHAIAHRFRRILGYTVAAMQLVCRMDAEDHLYVLWCGSMRLHCKRYAHLSFRLSPQGSVHEPYSLIERGRSSVAGSSPNSPRRRGASSPSPTRGSLAADDSTLLNEAQQAAMATVMQALSNLADSPSTTARKQRSGPLSNTQQEEPMDAESSAPPQDLELHAAPCVKCCVCRDPCPRGALVKVQLQWVLLCLSVMDRAAGASWDATKDVPPSVALVCPHLAKGQFDRLVALDRHRDWLRTNVGVCVACISDCNKANEMLFQQRLRAPSWLGVDDAYTRSTSRSVDTRQQLATQRAASGLSKLAEVLTNGHRAHAVDAVRDSEGLVQLKALLPAAAGIAADAASPAAKGTKRSSAALRLSVMHWHDHNAISFVGATREHLDAADLYKMDKGVWRRCGFGRPSVDLRYVAPTPHVASCSILDQPASVAAMLPKLAEVAQATEEDRLATLPCMERCVEAPQVCPGAPCQTPL